MADIFISYSSEDKTIVKQIAGLLENKGWSVWWDRQIPIGQKYDTVIENELHKSACVLVIWTQRSVASEWVKNEANKAVQENKLVPLVLEKVTLPLSFSRIESAMLIDWNGETDHPELQILYTSIDNILHHKNEPLLRNDDTDSNRKVPFVYIVTACIGCIVSVFLVYYYLHTMRGNDMDETDHRAFYLVLILFGISVSAFVFGLMNVYVVLKGGKRNLKLNMAGPVIGLMLIISGSFYGTSKSAEKIVTIRVFDYKKNPVPQGDVKIYLKEYIRSQSIDKMGQAQFTGIPPGMPGNKIKIEVSSPGYTTKIFDTLLTGAKPIELTLPFTTVVFITGRITNAADMPIKGVEIDVDGTRYFATSINDGSYNLRLEEYTLGDEITLTTSHKDFEDKTVSLRINSPDINKDIVLNPAKH
jgi:TIR domain